MNPASLRERHVGPGSGPFGALAAPANSAAGTRFLSTWRKPVRRLAGVSLASQPIHR